MPARDSNSVLAEIVERHGRIDLLKIDFEGLEYELTPQIPPEIASRVGRIAAEKRFADDPLAATHELSYTRPITTLVEKV